MIDLRDIEHAALRELQRAGGSGMTIAEVGASIAIRLELARYARISTGEPQIVVITQQGAAFLRRTAFA